MPAGEPPPEGEERRSELQPKITELTEELAETRRQAAELRDAADFGTRARDTILGMLSGAALAHAELQASRDLDLHTATASADTDPARAELERRVGEAEQRHADAEADHAETRGRLTDAEQRLDEATRRADTAARELAGERDRLRSLEDRMIGLQSEAQENRDRAGTAERERDEAEAARRQAEAALEPLMEARTRAEKELIELQDQVHKMGMERDELGRQAQAYDGVAVKARERAAEAEGDLQRTKARLDELEVWSAELERRLAEATTELSEVRSAAQADAAELRHLRSRDAGGSADADTTPAEEPAPEPAAPYIPRESAAARAVRAMGDADRSVSDSQLDEIRHAALSEATAQAERDLEDAAANGRG
jgi:chromosome segregation ATPase